MDIEDVAAFATGLDRVREKSCDGLRRWYVDSRLVARQLDATTVLIRSDFDARERMLVRHPGSFHVTPRFESHMMVLTDLERADPDAVAEAILAAWELQTR